MARLCFIVLVALSLSIAASYADVVGAAQSPADALYRAGRFNDARIAYRKILAGRPNDYAAIAHLGYITLFENRLDDAKVWLRKAMTTNPRDPRPRYALAQAFYRSDNFRDAATTLAGMRQADPVIAGNYSSMYLPKLSAFGNASPNVISGSGDSTRLKFVKLNPLPVVRLRVNGKSGLFFIDTGGGETVIDPGFARELNVQQVGSVKGRFSGGRPAAVGNGRLRTLGLGGWTLNNVPVQILGTRNMSAAFGVSRLDGILGTVVFYHFLTTLDYRNSELVLRRKGSMESRRFLSQRGASISVPMWLAGDHFMLSAGRVNALPPMLFFVDTGIAGAGAKLTREMIDRSRIRLDESKASIGAGSGGAIRTVPYTIPRLSLGGFTELNVPGVFDGPLPIATVLGFDVPGMIGHDAFLRHALTFDFSSMRLIIE